MKILLAIDNDGQSFDAAIAVSSWLPTDAEVTVLHVHRGSSNARAMAAMTPSLGSGVVGATISMGQLRAELEAEADKARNIAAAAAELTDADVRFEQGRVVSTIVQTASDLEADLIVVGTRDRTWLDRLLDPSVGQGVAQGAPCSVLVVR